MSRLGIVDLGSNTSRMVVYAYEPGEWFRQVDEIREPVRLGEGLGAGGRLRRRAVERALAALELYLDYARASRLPLEVLATSAVRDARNGDEFVREARRVGVELRVLAGEEEAALGVLAVANGFAFDDAWVVDLGGGSVQLSAMRGRAWAEGIAHPLGAVRVTEEHLASDPPRPAEIAAVERAVKRRLGADLALVAADDAPLVGMGGSLRNLARAVQKATAWPLDLVHGYFLRRDDLEALCARLLRLTSVRRARVRGLKPDRADVVAAAAIVWREIVRRSGRDGIWVSGQGLREGAFYRHFLPAPHLLASPRRFSVQNLFAHYEQPHGHTGRVRRFALRFFDQLAPLHGCGDRERELLEAACALHDIGITVGYHEHHRHGAYLVENASLPGFDHREHALLALLVRWHRKGTPRPELLAPLLAGGDRALLLRLTVCLRLAECLERSRAGRVRQADLVVTGKRLTLRVAADEDPWVELWEAGKQADLVRRAYGRELRLEVA